MAEARSRVRKQAATKAKPKAVKSKASSMTKNKKTTTTKSRTTAKQVTKPAVKKVSKTVTKTQTVRAKKTKAAASVTTAKKPKTTKSTTPKEPVKKVPIASERLGTVSSPVVTLPTRMSIRAKEKALVWADYFERSSHKPAYALTMTFGLFFIMFGSYIAVSQTEGFQCDGCVGQLLSSTETSLLNQTEPLLDPAKESLLDTTESLLSPTEPVITQQSTVSETGTAATTFQAPEVRLVTALPKEMTTDQVVYVEAVAVTKLDARLEYLKADGTKGTRSLNAESVPNNKYAIAIKASSLEPNGYTLKVVPYDTNGRPATVVTLGRFVVPQPVTETVTEAVLDTTSDVISTTEEVTGDALDTTTESVTNVTEPIVETVTTASVIRISGQEVVQGTATITITSNVRQYMSVYIRRLQSTERQLLGRVYGTSVNYVLDTRKFPNGDYEIKVLSTSQTDTGESNSLQMRIKNELQTNVIDDKDDEAVIEDRELIKLHTETSPLQTDPIKTVTSLIESDDSEFDDRDESDEEQSDDSDDDVVATVENPLLEPIQVRTFGKLQADSQTLNELLKRYSVAVQSGDINLIREAREAIERYRQTLVEQALNNDSDRLIADELSDNLSFELEGIVAKVETFESLRRERLGEDAARDTDGDGITDTDERLLFKTDPNNADTDGDGFTDGVEVVKGFNPNDSAAEAAIVYESPKETVGIVPNENLQVLAVEPDLLLPPVDDEEPIVQATVRGKGLPNSFVTLYIFSTPTVVTVRTEADGTFEYTFSKELEDGEHTVFVALTDNSGEIVAQSAPFTFVKQAEAFTAIAAEAAISGGVSGSISNTSGTSYQIVLGMSVLALGILLIMLGIGLRVNRPEQINLGSPA